MPIAMAAEAGEGLFARLAGWLGLVLGRAGPDVTVGLRNAEAAGVEIGRSLAGQMSGKMAGIVQQVTKLSLTQPQAAVAANAQSRR